MQNHFF